MLYVKLKYDKEDRNIQWRKTVFSRTGAGKIGQLRVKEKE